MQSKIIYLLTLMTLFSTSGISQTVSDFENLTLPIDSFWNGQSDPLGTSFSSGNADFPCFYDTSWGGFWGEGWAYSSMRDSLTPGFINQYSAIAAQGVDQSQNYAVGQTGATILLTGNAIGKAVQGLYVTNSTYAYITLRDGDQFARKFGDTTGTNSGLPQGGYPDWFKLTIKSWYNGVLGPDSIDFYLADFRFTNDTLDYIVKEWTYVDLASLGDSDSLKFMLSSSDVGQFGMNTPKFFCIDNFTTTDSPTGAGILSSNYPIFNLYPNPATESIMVHAKVEKAFISIFDINGRMVIQELLTTDFQKINISDLSDGLYIAKYVSGDSFRSIQFIKY